MTMNRVKHFEEIGKVSSRQRTVGFLSLNSLTATDLPNLLEMFHSVHGHRSLHHGAKKSEGHSIIAWIHGWIPCWSRWSFA